VPSAETIERSKEVITKATLRRLLYLARGDMESFFQRNPRYKVYEGKEVIVALCQGAALHYLDKKNGIKDFDVWFIYPEKLLTLPYRRVGVVDFGKSKFGVHPKAAIKGYEGRTIDVLMRSDSFFIGKDPENELVNYLKFRNSKTSRLLAQKAAIGLYPESLFGKPILRQ
jgi:hypothetical protein